MKRYWNRRIAGVAAALGGMMVSATAIACEQSAAPCDRETAGAMRLIRGGASVPVVLDGSDAGVERATRDLAGDLGRIGGGSARFASSVPSDAGEVVIVGVLGAGGIVDRLAAAGRIDVTDVAGRWEASVSQLVDQPMPGVRRALVIAGSDPRGAIFGAYDLSRRAGVSPWNWWADVPVARHGDLWLTAGRRSDAPAVKYRGIFLNDEAPALDGWVNKTFGGYNHKFYERVFELTLRLKGNFLWPAMWGKSLWDDDIQSAVLADRMGVVLGTSHHEPMVRAHIEWERHGKGPWDYTKNAATLRDFWRAGIRRMGDRETLVTVGMRGDGDEPMTGGTATRLLEKIVDDQRRILTEVTGKPAERTPQVWALYKEVQDYYDAGMRVPDDVTLLFADDNWGNIRRLPEPGATRAGGHGVYYHFDYVGGPRNYKWINTTQIGRVWEQMGRAHAHGADRLWIVNVGDLKPMEYPISFFLDQAWAPARFDVARMTGYPQAWATEQFGARHAADIAPLLTGYTRMLSRRKPELLSADTFDLPSGEADRVLAEWNVLEREANAVAGRLAPEQRDAFFQLVQHPILAGANLTRMYVAVGRNRLHAAQGRADANRWADEARRLFANDAAIRRRYEEDVAGGKWTMMMAQTHIGYTGWQQPPADSMPELISVTVPATAALGVAVPNDPRGWRAGERGANLPVATPGGGAVRFQLYNRGTAPLSYRVTAGHPAVRIASPRGRVGLETQEVALSVDWRRAPRVATHVPVTVTGPDGTIELSLPIDPVAAPAGSGFVEQNGVVAIEATDYAASGGTGTTWTRVPDLGRTGSAVVSMPATAPAGTPDASGAWLEYPVWLREGGAMTVEVLASPSLDVTGKGTLRYAVSIDDGPARVVDLLAGETERTWDRAVADNVRVGRTAITLSEGGAHRVRLWRIDPGVVFQRIHLRRGNGTGREYLGPVASPRR